MEREASRNEALGIAWWNGLLKADRAYWLREAQSAVPADAWAEFQRRRGMAWFAIRFTTPEDAQAGWHRCATFEDEAAARRAYELVVDSDIAEGASEGWRWRLVQERRDEIMNILIDKCLTSGGLVDAPADEA